MTQAIDNTNKYTNYYQQRFQFIAGVDEVGRGPLAGPVIAAAVILPKDHTIDGLTDSKKLTAKRRDLLYEKIIEQAIAHSFGRAEAEEIDSINIFQASLLAMKRAIDGLKIKPDVALIDGKFIPELLAMPAQAIIKGDLLEQPISAAAIIAKVTRDKEMMDYELSYPGYGFANHKGYPTKQHINALADLGICEIHRRSFAPVKSYCT